MKIGILGRGFGIYGYLPASHELGWEIHTLGVYRESVLARGELVPFSRQVVYQDSESDVVASVDAIVIARDAGSQAKFLFENRNDLKRVFLEKPLGVTSLQNKRLLKLLKDDKIDFSVGYLFPYLEWYQEILKNFNEDGKNIEIEWKILRPHAMWKSNSNSGGGLTNFYFIHFATLIHDLSLEISDVKLTEDRIQFNLVGKEKNCIVIKLFFSRVASFCIKKEFDSIIFQAESPFSRLPTKGLLDPRVPYLKKYLVDESLGSKGKRSLDLESLSLSIRSFG
jgi:predicted dehydrogenase